MLGLIALRRKVGAGAASTRSGLGRVYLYEFKLVMVLR
jgi:hypothetical protein